MTIDRRADTTAPDGAERRRRGVAGGLALFLSIFAFDVLAAGPPDPTGTWLIADGRARIRIEKCGPQEREICGFVVWMYSPLDDDDGRPRIDVRNPDPRKRAPPVLGLQMMMGLKPDGSERFRGKVYDSEEGKFVDVSVSMDADDALEIHGCLLAILCGSQSWTRADDVAPGQLTGPVNGPKGPRADPEWAPKPGVAAAGKG